MDRMMHVLFIPSWYPSQPGDMAGCFFREQALALRDHGMRVGVITPAFRSLTQWPEAACGGYGLQVEIDEGIGTLRYHGVRAFSWNHSLNMVFWERTGLQAFDEYQYRFGRPDVLHVHAMIFGLTWAAAIHRVHGIPFVITEHSSEYIVTKIRPSILTYLRQNIVQSARVFAVSTYLAKTLQASVPLSDDRCWEVIPNMVSSLFGVAATKSRHTLNNKHRVILSIASLQPNKGHHHLLQALRIAIDAGSDFQLRIGGSGPQENHLKMLANALNLNNHVTFLGHCSREQVAEEMAAADAFVLTSSHETFGIVVIEALLSGKPVLSTRCGGPEDIIVDGKDGYLVSKDDPAALAEGLLCMGQELDRFDPHDLRKRCLVRFSESAFASRHAKVYRDVISHSSQLGHPL